MDAQFRRLDVVFDECKNDFQLFLSTIAEYLSKMPDFSTFDLTHVSQLFVNAANSSKTHVDEQNGSNASVHESSTNTDNETTIVSNGSEQMIDDNSRDMFDNNGDDDEMIIPETQYFEESNDSGESITIPLRIKMNGNTEQYSSDASESEDFQVRPEETANDHIEQQSQLVLDRSILHDIKMLNTNTNDSDILMATQTVSSDKEPNAIQTNNDRVDRSASITPDLDDINNANAIEKERLADDEQDDDMNETQMFSQSICDASIQQHLPPDTTDDPFLAATQPTVFKLPRAISTPRAKTKKNQVAEIQDMIFDAETQKPPETSIYDQLTQQVVASEDIYEAATQMDPQQNVFEVETQMDSQQDVFEAETQIADEDEIFEVATQVLRPSNRPASTKKTISWEQADKSDAQKSKPHNVSDDLFDLDTQAFEVPVPPSDVSDANDDLNETAVFDMPTQPVNLPSTSHNIPKKSFTSAVLTQSSQPANTPVWSLAARITDAQIDKFEKEQAEIEAKKRNERLKKNKYLFATSEDEDENDDDLEFDLAIPNQRERIPSNKENLKRYKSDDSLKRPSSATSDDSDSLSKKSKPTGTSGDKFEDRLKSVKLSRSAVNEFMKNEQHKQQSVSKVSVATRETSKNAKAIQETKSSRTTETRSMRGRKTDTPTTSSDSGSNKRKVTNPNEEPQPKEKRDRRETRAVKDAPKSKSTASSSKAQENEPKTRSGKKDKAKEREKNDSPVIAITNIPDSHLLSSMKRRSSDRPSTRYSSRPSILFTKVNSAPYANMIQNLGGCIVDTPQLGTVLICDKISRTFKFLYALSKGIPIVSSHWLDASGQRGEFEPTDPYLVVDKNSEKRFRFSLKRSLETARQTPLFLNYHICATPNVQPIASEIAEIVECSGGKYADSPLKKRKSNTIAVLISHKKDNKMWKQYKDAHPDIQIVNSEGFLQSVVQQKINFPSHILA